MKQISDVDTTTSSSPALGPGVVIDRSVRPRDSRKDARPREGAARPVSLCASFWHTGMGPARALGAAGSGLGRSGRRLLDRPQLPGVRPDRPDEGPVLLEGGRGRPAPLDDLPG